jgi:hypothetical protein
VFFLKINSLQKSFEYVEIIFFRLKFDKIKPKRKKRKESPIPFIKIKIKSHTHTKL